LSLEVEEVVAEGEKVVVLVRVRGTYAGELPSVPPTGRRICVRGVEILDIPDGGVRGRWSMFDVPGLMRQMGATPKGSCNGHRNRR